MVVDIYQKVVADFGEESTAAIEVLEDLDAKTKGMLEPRVERMIIFLAKGSLTRLRELSQTSYQDLQAEAEKQLAGGPAHDFSKTFHELKLLGGTSPD